MDVVEDMFNACCMHVKQRITTDEEWGAFCERLMASQVVDGAGLRDLDRLWRRTRPFGDESGSLSFQEFVDCLVEGFGGQLVGTEALQMDQSLDRVLNQIENLKDICVDWAPGAKQTKQMMLVVNQLRNEHMVAQGRVKTFQQSQRNAFLLQTFASKRDVSDQEHGAHFQRRFVNEIEKVCAATRVRGIVNHVDAHGQRRTTPYNPPDRFQWVKQGTLDLTLGQTSHGEYVDVVHLDSPSASDNDVIYACNCHAAHRELILSKFFPSWMGYSKHGELYFEHFSDAVSMAKLVQKHGILMDPQPLLYSILSQTLHAMSDLLEQSTFDLRAPISLNNVMLVNRGTRVLLGGLDWGNKVDYDNNYMAWHVEREKRFLIAFGKMITELVGLEHMIEDSGKSTEKTQDGLEQFVFNRAECESGLRVPVGARFRLALPPTRSGKVWRCIKIVERLNDTSAMLTTTSRKQRFKIIQLDSPDHLEFVAKGPGLCRLFLKEVEWWQVDPTEDSVLPESDGDDLKGAQLMCKVFVRNPNQQDQENQLSCSPALHAVISACSINLNDTSFIHLRDLLENYRMFHLDTTTETRENVAEDFHLYIAQ